MNFRQLQLFKFSLQLLDLLLVWASFIIAIELRVLWLEFLNFYTISPVFMESIAFTKKVAGSFGARSPSNAFTMFL